MKSITRLRGLWRAPGVLRVSRVLRVLRVRAIPLLALAAAVSACSTLAWASSLEAPATEMGAALGAGVPGRSDLRDLEAEAKAEAEALLAGKRQIADKLAAKYASQYRISIDLADAILDHSGTEGIDPDIAFRLVQTESSFKRTAVSSAGAIGYAQIKPSTAMWLDSTVSSEDLFDRDTNLRLGFGYLAMLADKYDQDMRMALLAYNRGPARVRRMIAAGQDPANGYARRILQSRS